MEELIGDSILLRKYRMDDVECILQWRNDRNTTLYMGKHFRDYASPEQVTTTVRETINSESSNSLFYVIAYKNSREYIGGISLTSIDHVDKTCILSIVIGQEKCRNKGIASEAIRLLMAYAFGKLKLHKIELNVYEKNVAALKCYQKNGFVIEGISREHMLINGRYENLVRMGILESEHRNFYE